MRVRVRGTLSRVRARAGALRGSAASPPWLRLLPLACILIIITALGILAVSEISMLGKQGSSPAVIGGAGAAARIMPGRVHKHPPSPNKQAPTSNSAAATTPKSFVFKMEPLLRRNALSVELWAQITVNRFRSRLVATRIHQENVLKRNDCLPPPLPDCPRVPPNIRGPINVTEWLENQKDSSSTMSAIDKEIEEAIDSETLAGVSRGGTWIPDDCTSRHSVAIIIPYRDREKQLNLLMKYLPPVLKRHQINYSIFVVEQMGNETFNKGVLMNAGFLTALDRPANGVMYHCFIFHDVDLLPEDDRNMYTCPPQPRHLSVAVNELHYKLPYRVLVGGVFAVRTEHFLRLNGYSNLYWGWGGEDDDMGYRVEHVLSSISRPPEWVARYTMIKHEKRRPLSRRVRTKLLRTSWRRYRLDGLNTVSYGLGPIVQHNHYTHVMIDVGPPPTTYRIIEEEEENNQ
ncbi:Galactosyl_T_2 [Nesidiocoris tenuis]|uniref:Beta-1,4-N-acetylgalactosaminyltransferase n=1 Tax=Nesidiocoris tenuis TaxID=355587 RepID=A0ABN7A5T8_9HEMI|nr:Galactosyl_T_2 [Nesidiocoris tenuis]